MITTQTENIELAEKMARYIVRKIDKGQMEKASELIRDFKEWAKGEDHPELLISILNDSLKA